MLSGSLGILYLSGHGFGDLWFVKRVGHSLIKQCFSNLSMLSSSVGILYFSRHAFGDLWLVNRAGHSLMKRPLC